MPLRKNYRGGEGQQLPKSLPVTTLEGHTPFTIKTESADDKELKLSELATDSPCKAHLNAV